MIVGLLSVLLLAVPAGALELVNVRVKDGDTLAVSIKLPLDITLDNQTIRAGDFDACESSKTRQAVEVTSAEVAIGKAAKASLAKLVAGAKKVWFVPYKKLDKYGRRLGVLYVDDLRLKDWAESNSFTRAQLPKVQP